LFRCEIIEKFYEAVASARCSLQSQARQHVVVAAPSRIVVTNVDVSGDVRAMMVPI
jgi:hypothetical protein